MVQHQNAGAGAGLQRDFVFATPCRQGKQTRLQQRRLTANEGENKNPPNDIKEDLVLSGEWHLKTNYAATANKSQDNPVMLQNSAALGTQTDEAAGGLLNGAGFTLTDCIPAGNTSATPANGPDLFKKATVAPSPPVV